MKVVFNKGAQKDFAKLDKMAQKLVLRKALEVENLPDHEVRAERLWACLGVFGVTVPATASFATFAMRNA